MDLLLVIFAQTVTVGGAAASSPIQIEVIGDFATFTHRDHSGNRIGYRFHEHTPLIHGAAPHESKESDQPDPSIERQVERFQQRPGVKTHRRRVDDGGWIPQLWTFYLAPADDGIDMLLLVETEESALPAFYGIQQCFRLSGATNSEWRHKYALTPAFSEYDCWERAPDGEEKTSLTWVLRGGALQQLPVCTEAVGYRTPYGEAIDLERSGKHLDALKQVGPYEARMLETAEAGLILRSSQSQDWSCGLYWERTTHVTNHHPADCLHAIVNIGGIPPHSKRALRGKIYWLPGSGDELVRHWRRDFPHSEQSAAIRETPNLP